MPRIAFFPDSFHEVNGVAHTARHFVAFAERRGIPMLCVRAGAQQGIGRQQGSVQVLELKRGPFSIRVEQDLSFDPFFLRHMRLVGKALAEFRPDIIHITGPSELGILGALFAWRLGIPLVASWHTNVHEYAGKRIGSKLRTLPAIQSKVSRWTEELSLSATARFYRLARVLYAPNPVLCEMLRQRVKRPCYLMRRGVDTELFSPRKRAPGQHAAFILGYVGRLSVEKNVGLLPMIQRSLPKAFHDILWVIVGHGAEEKNLSRELGSLATFTGVLRGEDLARAYAGMDLLIFPSHTDTFGNVVLEALASGTPALVTPDGGPVYIVQDGVTGRICEEDAFAAAITELAGDPERLLAMRAAARAYALTCSWDAVFEGVLATYPAS